MIQGLSIMPVPATWLDETSINTTTLPFSIGADLGTRVLQLAGGNLLILWQSNVDAGAGAPFGSDIIGRILNPAGDPVTGEFRLNASHSAANELHADIAALPGGGFAVVYEDRVGSVQSLYLDMFDASGAFIPAASTLIESFSYLGPSFNAQITALSAGSVYVAYDNYRGTQAIAGRIYDTGTGSLSAPVSLSGGVPIDAVTLANGNVVVLRYSGPANNAQMAFDMVSPLGAVIMSSTLGLTPTDAALVALAGGGFAIAFSGTSYSRQGSSLVVSRYDNAVRSYDALGNFVAYGDFFVATTGNQAETPTLAALPNGNFEMIYRDGQGHLHALDFSASAQLLGQVDFATRPMLAAIDRIDPVAVGLADGRFAVLWTAGNTVTQSIRLEILDTQSAVDTVPFYTPPGQFGTVGDDVIALAAGSTYIAAGPGNDTLTGGGTASRLIGGTGDDVYIIFNAADVGRPGYGPDSACPHRYPDKC
jgi:Ca2+-binding RTX toxin-like protein